jgi:two-component system OmpR family sensor kinase
MQTKALKLSSQVIAAHMMNWTYEYKRDGEYAIGFYDTNRNWLFGDRLKETVWFEKGFYEYENRYYLIDRSAQQHLGVEYIVVVHYDTQSIKEDLIWMIAVVTLLAMGVVVVVGYLLSKMFLKPIQADRKRLDRFIKDSTHELNTPITALMLSVEGLKEGEAISAKVLNRIKISKERISALYANLSYQLLSDQNAQPEIKRIDCKEVVEDEIELSSLYAKSKEVRIIANMDHCWIDMDEESAKRLVNNLLSNAIKYNRRGGEVNITLSNEKLVIADSGVGIAKQNQDKIFHRYYRDNDYAGGFGIGMDIVNHIASRYELEIELESELGEGTTVTIKRKGEV